MSPFPQFDDFQKLAAQIAPSETPSWLAKHLIWQGQDLGAELHFGLLRRTRGKSLQRLQTLLASPTDTQLHDLKSMLSCRPFDISPAKLKSSDDIIAQGLAAAASLRAADGRARRARGKKLNADEPHPKTLCAAILLELIDALQQKIAGPRRAEIAQAYFDLLGHYLVGIKPSISNNTFTAWRPHFERKQRNPIVQAKRRVWRLTVRQTIERGRVPFSFLDVQLDFYVKPAIRSENTLIT